MRPCRATRNFASANSMRIGAGKPRLRCIARWGRSRFPPSRNVEGATRLNKQKLLELTFPTLALVFALLVWEFAVRFAAIPPYILPAPSLILETLVKDWVTLYGSLLVTLRITFEALLAAVLGGVALAMLFAQSRI